MTNTSGGDTNALLVEESIGDGVSRPDRIVQGSNAIRDGNEADMEEDQGLIISNEDGHGEAAGSTRQTFTTPDVEEVISFRSAACAYFSKKVFQD